MRGNQLPGCWILTPAGSIPAHAGKPGGAIAQGGVHGVYPRACGETREPLPVFLPGKGLSPRMRGNHTLSDFVDEGTGSIPAHAGKPYSRRSPSTRSWVYPRACGETAHTLRLLTPPEGLSPRMRGNLPFEPLRGGRPRSIPAHAGKPRGKRGRIWPTGVYPRACGETNMQKDPHSDHWGLSPRMRGNLPQNYIDLLVSGSIPAHAGKPKFNLFDPRGKRVYPRACGETCGRQANPFLSLGSIPAHAGKPTTRR